MSKLDKLEELLGADKVTPMEALKHAYDSAPHALIKDHLDHAALELMAVQLPKIQDVLSNSPVMDVTELTPLTEVFEKALASEDKPKDFTATLADVGAQVAELIDTSVRRVVGEETQINRMAGRDLLVLHAQLMATLSDLVLTDEQKAMIAERNAKLD